MAKIGLLFGSFNPPHSGHLLLAEEALKQQFCDEVWFMLQLNNQFKKVAWPVSSEHRMQMLRLLAGSDKRLSAHVTSAEKLTVTLEALSKAYPGVQFGLVMGEDLAKSFKNWQDYAELKKYQQFSAPRFNLVSSLKVKKQLRGNKPVTGLVPKPIENYIRQQQLYLNNS